VLCINIILSYYISMYIELCSIVLDYFNDFFKQPLLVILNSLIFLIPLFCNNSFFNQHLFFKFFCYNHYFYFHINYSPSSTLKLLLIFYSFYNLFFYVSSLLLYYGLFPYFLSKNSSPLHYPLNTTFFLIWIIFHYKVHNLMIDLL